MAWDLPTPPRCSPEDVCRAVAAHAATPGPDEWITGGLVGSPATEKLAAVGMPAPCLPHACSTHGPEAGDASTRTALDAIAVVRERHGSRPAFPTAHTEYVAPPPLPARPPSRTQRHMTDARGMHRTRQ
ncbi:hypothetical protein [Kitasatospora sp. NPDC057500]|uniref:hypothetical protein n=1 Tax=Kitasatospora sp. NPDC057500 TaxID=3346151 RepID=UPI0036BFBD94